MLEALIHRKHRNAEDCLTSAVFGMLQHVPPELGLYRFLANARTIAECYPLKDLAGIEKHTFWPRWENCEHRHVEFS